MRQIYPDLWQTTPEHPFGEHMSTHAYLLLRDEGNVLFYNSAIVADYDNIAALGGIRRQYLSHKDEVGPSLVEIRERFGALLCCHKLDAGALHGICPVDVVLERRETHLGGLEIIPTPGHTPGSTCFLFASRYGKRYLFVGDTIFPVRGEWGTYVSRPQRRRLIESLKLLRTLEVDVVFSSGSVGPRSFEQVSPTQWRRTIESCIAELAAPLPSDSKGRAGSGRAL
jgi:glyoxylase-like metal-dependent hydrolase (beta-lactamase superfamily II)